MARTGWSVDGRRIEYLGRRASLLSEAGLLIDGVKDEECGVKHCRPDYEFFLGGRRLVLKTIGLCHQRPKGHAAGPGQDRRVVEPGAAHSSHASARPAAGGAQWNALCAAPGESGHGHVRPLWRLLLRLVRGPRWHALRHVFADHLRSTGIAARPRRGGPGTGRRALRWTRGQGHRRRGFADRTAGRLSARAPMDPLHHLRVDRRRALLVAAEQHPLTARVVNASRSGLVDHRHGPRPRRRHR